VEFRAPKKLIQTTEPAFNKQSTARAQEGEGFRFEHRLLMPDGSVKACFMFVGHASKEDESGTLEFVGAITDITERKHAEEILQRSEAYFIRSAKAEPQRAVGHLSRRPAKHTYWSEEIFRITGFDPQAGRPRFGRIRAAHPSR